MAASLFEPFRLRGLEPRNRLALSPDARPVPRQYPRAFR
jgi:hypothetical protein